MVMRKSAKKTRRADAFILGADAAAMTEEQAARYIKWATKEIKASRTRSARISKRIDRLSRETDAVLARLAAAG